ncbi:MULTISPECIES: hypothetical protein [Streptomyces]|uniref:hypothetical protein n=1 Tax=Streptomyces TaxID=1883 RepID=UPI000B9EB125|nr:hypothetical protein [Streptomyces kasugaensis]
MFTLAAAGIPSGQILGTLGASGAALVITVLLVLGCKGKHRIKFDADQAAWVGILAGTLYATAANVWSAPGSISAGIARSLQGLGGHVGMGAVALLIVVLIYGLKLKPAKAALLGIAAASIFGLAGGIWAMFSNILASGLNQVLGVA